ncbi:MAG: phosphatidate phosphatase App1 family protein [Myxococcaceae bacterium]
MRNLEVTAASRQVARFAGVLAIVLAASAWAEPGVLVFPALGTTQKVTISGRVLKEAPSEGTSVWSRNVRSLTASTWEGAELEVGYDGQKQKVVSGEDGAFEVTFSAQKDHPFVVGRGLAEGRVSGAIGRAPVTIIADDAPFVLISDFDDTIAVSNVQSKSNALATALFKDAGTHPVVEGMPNWYRCLINDTKSRPGFAVVSGSPVQFVPRISGFMAKNDFPVGGLYLRTLSAKTLSDYKQPIIRALMQRIPQSVVLVGDSGEHDPEVYKQIRGEFPGRVLAVYIHDVGKDDDPARFKDMMLFKDPKSAAADSVKRGFMSEACFEKEFKK